MSHLFGPVPSRRLGRSLGIDLVPFKTCSYDCIYCQLGRTTNKTIERKEWVPLAEVITELKEKLDTKPDYITLSGSGEPTLYSRIEELIEEIKSLTKIPVAVLTNGSLLWQEKVRKELLNADLVMPSLDAGNAFLFEAVNRPHQDISFEKMLEGLISFRQEYSGQYWLEVLLLSGHTALNMEVSKIAECVYKIGPDRVQLNTASRPTAEEWAGRVALKRMEEFADFFYPKAEVTMDFHGVHKQSSFRAGQEDIIQMLKRRPCTSSDIADGLNMHLNEVLKYLEELTAQGLLNENLVSGKHHYFLRADQVTGDPGLSHV